MISGTCGGIFAAGGAGFLRASDMQPGIRRLVSKVMSKRLLLFALLSACTTASSEPKSNTAPPDEPGVKAGRKQSFTDSEYAEHIRALRQKLKKHGLDRLNVRIEDPFVVVGDGTMVQLERSSGTVRWAADKLEQDFF